MENTDEFRQKLANFIIAIAVIGLIIVSYIIIKEDGENSQMVFNALLPLLGTWVGTILAFYYGTKNYEAASKGYKSIISSLTPEVLDDIKVDQIMIARKTMVALKWSDVKDKTVNEIYQLLLNLDKSRLPIFGDNDQIQYIIHRSLLAENSEEFVDINSSMQSPGPPEDLPATPLANANPISSPTTPSTKKPSTMSEFVTKHKGVIDKIIWVGQNEILEKVRQKMIQNPNVQDIFVKNEKGELVGWLTNTLILRYINSKKL